MDLVGTARFAGEAPVLGKTPNMGTPSSRSSRNKRAAGKPASTNVSPKSRTRSPSKNGRASGNAA
eukprot:9087923-Lingulodinium_polyedra.AAC.1